MAAWGLSACRQTPALQSLFGHEDTPPFWCQRERRAAADFAILTLGSQDLAAVLRPLDATSWAEVPLALQLETPEGRTVLLKRRKLPHPSFDPLSDLPTFPRATGPEANHCYWGYSGSRTNYIFGWYGTNQQGAFLRICHTTPKIRLRLPHNGNEEVLQDGYRLVLLPKLAYYAMWDGHGECFAVARATSKGAEASLPSGSYTSAPDMGTDTPGHPSAFRTDAHSKPEVASEGCPELLLRDWLPGLAAEPRVSVLAPGSPGGTTPGWDRAHVVARSTVSPAPLAAPQDGDLPGDDASDASDASTATVNSSTCDRQSPDEIPVITPPDLAAVLASLTSSLLR